MASIPIEITQELLQRFASTISQECLGLVECAPESWARPMQCFQNVRQKVRRNGGRGVCGWAFLGRVSPEHGPYLIAMHHAVWGVAGSTQVLDITPFHENQMHRPYCPETGSIAFLLDDAAQPKIIEHELAPLASRFFPIAGDPALAAYLEELSKKEHEKCQRLYEGALRPRPSSE